MKEQETRPDFVPPQEPTGETEFKEVDKALDQLAETHAVGQKSSGELPNQEVIQESGTEIKNERPTGTGEIHHDNSDLDQLMSDIERVSKKGTRLEDFAKVEMELNEVQRLQRENQNPETK